MTKEIAQSRTLLSGNVGWLTGKTIRAALIATVIVGLTAMNLLTLLNDQIHEVAYGAIKGLLASVLTDVALSRALNHSPTAKRKNDVAVATKKLTDKHNALSATNANLQKKHDALVRSQRVMEGNHRLLKQRLNTQNATVYRVSNRLAKRTLANAARNVSSLAGEAIPLIGTTVIVGVTALDIRDACESMRDSNTLNAMVGQSPVDETKVCGIKLPNTNQLIAQVQANWQGAYKSAADIINDAGSVLVPAKPPQFSWSAAMAPLCSTLGNFPGVCP